jgi:dihydrofolate reductase
MSLVRVHNFSISLDGFGTGEGQSHDAHFGHAGERLHEWMFATRWWQPGGSGGVDDAFAQQHDPGIGAEIMGAGKFGHPGWHEDPEWKGAWGPNPPFHTPVFVLTHHTRPSIKMEGGTTFHFIDASPAEALQTARKAADGQDIRLGGGPQSSATSWPLGWSITCTPSWSRSCSAEACASGTDWRASRKLQGRGHLLAQRSHACDVHPRGCLNCQVLPFLAKASSDRLYAA